MRTLGTSLAVLVLLAVGFASDPAHAQGDVDPEAVADFLNEAEQGNAEAQYNLALAYRHGEGVIEDFKFAAYWLTRAVEQGGCHHMEHLGKWYAYGLGTAIPRDYAYADMWLDLAAAAGCDADHIRKLRNIVKQSMTPAEIEDSQRLARECIAKNYKDC